MTSHAPDGRIYPHSWRLRLLLGIAVLAVVCLAALIGCGMLRL